MSDHDHRLEELGFTTLDEAPGAHAEAGKLVATFDDLLEPLSSSSGENEPTLTSVVTPG